MSTKHSSGGYPVRLGYPNHCFASTNTETSQIHVPLSQASKTCSILAKSQTGMSANDWITRWEEKSKVIRWQLTDVHPFLEKYAPSSTTNPRVLVPLAGKTTDLLWLVEKEFQVIGVECSALAVQELLDEYVGVNNYTIENRSPTCSIYSAYNNRLLLIVCDIFADELTPSLIGGRASLVWDRAALTALHPADHIRYIEKLRQLSDAHAQHLISVYWHPGPTDQGPPFSISTECINKLFPHDKVIQLDDIDAKNERWAGTTYEQLRERCYRIVL